MMKTLATVALAAAFAALAALTMPSTAAAAADEKMLKYRNGVMWSLAAHLGGIFQNIRGEVDAKANIPHHAKALAPIAAAVVAMFPPGSEGGRTKPEIWSDRAGFEKAAADLVAAANALAAVADSGDPGQIGAAAGAVGKACGGCHRPYRAEKK